MSKEVVCPHCGSIVAIDPPVDLIVSAGLDESRHTVELTLPVTSDDLGPSYVARSEVHDATAQPAGALGVFVAGDAVDRPEFTTYVDSSSGSADSLQVAELDPFLGEFVPPSFDAETAVLAGSGGGLAINEDAASSLEKPEAEAVTALEGLNLDPAQTSSPRSAAQQESDEEEDEEPGRVSLGTVLLASYASAVSLALAYVVWSHRDRGPTGPETMAADTRPERGADGGRLLKPAPALPADHLASIGRPIRLGDLEITPIEVRKAPVRLSRPGSGVKGSARTELGETLQLRLKIKNTSTTIFVPLDPKLVRAPDLGPPETYLETGRGDRIDPYPLAIASEWEIVGQPLAPLKGGETRETLIVSEKDASERLDDPLTWRIPVRVSPDHVESIGVRFRTSEIR